MNLDWSEIGRKSVLCSTYPIDLKKYFLSVIFFVSTRQTCVHSFLVGTILNNGLLDDRTMD